jgi:hypothetical protein
LEPALGGQERHHSAAKLLREVVAEGRQGQRVGADDHFVKETDELLRASNRTFARILASLPVELACRCGHAEVDGDVEERLRRAIEARDWQLAATLTNQLAMK